jgi:hypothetical protein
LVPFGIIAPARGRGPYRMYTAKKTMIHITSTKCQ